MMWLLDHHRDRINREKVIVYGAQRYVGGKESYYVYVKTSVQDYVLALSLSKEESKRFLGCLDDYMLLENDNSLFDPEQVLDTIRKEDS